MGRIGLSQNFQSLCFLHSTASLHTQLAKAPNFSPNFKNPKVITVCMAAATPAVAPTSFGFKNLMETVTIDVHKAEGRPLNVPLIAPFTIASSRLDKVENVAIRIELSNGCVGWGEAPILPFVTAEDQNTALEKAAEACEFLRQSREMTLNLALTKIGDVLPGHDFASVSYTSNFFCFVIMDSAIKTLFFLLHIYSLTLFCVSCDIDSFDFDKRVAHMVTSSP